MTSLGSTTVLKLLSNVKVEDSVRGVYSHRFMASNTSAPLAPLWLVGGASNVGCSILRQENFTNNELDHLSQSIDPYSDSPLDYYPLCKAGERFPLNDPNKKPVLDPKPLDDGIRSYRAEYLHGILQGIANVEKEGYKVLQDLGATPLSQV